MIPEDILNVLKRSIHSVCENISCYCNDPVSDFTRKRKLPAINQFYLTDTGQKLKR